MRYLTQQVQYDVAKKLVFLAGPRQVGKSTLARSLIQSPSQYLNWDIASDRKIIRDVSWSKNDGLVVFDELHKFVKWKNFLKGIIDEYGNVPPILVTGSARLETFKRGGDALTGRTFMYHLHPIDPLEAVDFFGAVDPFEASQKLIKTGGFPEAFLNPNDAARLREDRLQMVLREDIRDLSMISELRGMQLLIDLLRDRVGGTINYSNLASDVGVSAPTIKKWVELLERLYVLFLLHPFSRNISRSIRKEPKVYFYDCAVGTNGEGYCFENLIGLTLLKWIQFANDTVGSRFGLSYFRDKDKHEVDFVVTDGLKPIILVEAKLSDCATHSGLIYLKKIVPSCKAFQIVGARIKREEKLDIRKISVADIGELRDLLKSRQL
jgi:predicted AAA+ superfamily ATPase